MTVHPVVAAEQQPGVRLSAAEVTEMSQAFGFCYGQNLRLDAIATRYPRLRLRAEAAKLRFQSAFGAAAQNIDEALSRVNSSKWREAKEQMKSKLAEVTALGETDDVVAFVALVEKRAEGEIESRILASLLAWHPQYRQNPVAEFGTFKTKYVCDGTGKAKGLKFQLEHPKSWASLEAERPNIVRKFVSNNGRGMDTALVIVVRLEGNQSLTAKEVGELFSASGLRSLLPPNAMFKTGKPIRFDGLPGAMLEYTFRADRMGQEVTMDVLTFITVYRNLMVNVQFSTASGDGAYARLLPLFRVMANSFVLTSQYE
jgi:hypothetical protein